MNIPKHLVELRNSVDEKKLRFSAPKDHHYNALYDDTCIIADKANPDIPLIGYYKFPNEFPGLLSTLEQIRYEKNYRTGGLPTQSRIFGYSPRIVMRKDFCSSTRLAEEFPKAHKQICDWGEVVSEFYEQLNPVLFQKHIALTKTKVLPEWQIKNTPFTSGIINKNNPLRYHFDSGNFKDVWSCMYAVKSGMTGGHLIIPSLDIALDCNNALVMFDGQKLLHGVSPIKVNSLDAYRYSIVYYSLKGMWNCGKVDRESG